MRKRQYLQKEAKKTLTETVANYKNYLPKYLPLLSPRNRFWLTKNPWFEVGVFPELRKRVEKLI